MNWSQEAVEESLPPMCFLAISFHKAELQFCSELFWDHEMPSTVSSSSDGSIDIEEQEIITSLLDLEVWLGYIWITGSCMLLQHGFFSCLPEGHKHQACEYLGFGHHRLWTIDYSLTCSSQSCCIFGFRVCLDMWHDLWYLIAWLITDRWYIKVM